MSVERVDYSSDSEYQQALQQEQDYYNKQQEQEPNVVPCNGCGCQMYQDNEIQKYNFCQDCKDIINKADKQKEKINNDLPF